MQPNAAKRNQFVDIMRGIAMLLVVLGHTMTGCTVGSQKPFFSILYGHCKCPYSSLSVDT